MRIKKTAAVIQLELARWGKLKKRVVDLCRDRTNGHTFGECVAPQIAHHTAKRTFFISNKDGGNRHHDPIGRPLFFCEVLIRQIRIEFLPRRATAQDPGINFRAHGYKDRNFWRYSAS